MVSMVSREGQELPQKTFEEIRASMQDLVRKEETEGHTCCYHVAAAKMVLADRERELLELKGPCSTKACRLHYAHSGPCDVRKEVS